MRLQLEKLISKNYYLHQSAKDGYRAYIQSYASYSLKKIFNVHELDLKKVGKAFGFPTPPAVSLPVRGSTNDGAHFLSTLRRSPTLPKDADYVSWVVAEDDELEGLDQGDLRDAKRIKGNRDRAGKDKTKGARPHSHKKSRA